MRSFEVDHAGHPAIGYLIGSRTSTGLKEEYKRLDAESLRDLVKSGVVIQSDPIETIEVAYTGDTCARGLVRQPVDMNERNMASDYVESAKKLSDLYKQQLFRAEVILCELTFLDSSEDSARKSLAEKRGHIHICDVEQIFVCTEQSIDDAEGQAKTISIISNPKHIVFYHLSGRYTPATRALDCIAEGLPRQYRNRCQIAINSMLSQEEKTKDAVGKLVQPNGCISLAAYLAWRDRPK